VETAQQLEQLKQCSDPVQIAGIYLSSSYANGDERSSKFQSIKHTPHRHCLIPIQGDTCFIYSLYKDNGCHCDMSRCVCQWMKQPNASSMDRCDQHSHQAMGYYVKVPVIIYIEDSENIATAATSFCFIWVVSV
jgi:hypothetical protein